MTATNANALQKKSVNADGLHRVAHTAIYPDILVRILCDLSAVVREDSGDMLYGLLNEVAGVVSGIDKPADTHIRNRLLYTNPTHIEDLMGVGMREPRNRVSIRTSITTRGNLSVTIAPEMLNSSGLVRSSP